MVGEGEDNISALRTQKENVPRLGSGKNNDTPKPLRKKLGKRRKGAGIPRQLQALSAILVSAKESTHLGVGTQVVPRRKAWELARIH